MDERLIAGRYALNEPLGGSSWRATDTELGREVVVRLGASGATGAALLSHPSIARVFDHGEADGEQFVVREYLPGGSLEERGAASLSEDAAQVAASDVAAALAYAHGQGVAHGALSEANVLFDAEDRAKVADFTAEGEPQDDVLAFGAILQSLATAAPALGPLAAAALAGELDSSELAAQLDDIRPVAVVAEPTTVIAAPRAAPPEPTPAGRRRVVAAVAIAAFLLVAGLGARVLRDLRRLGHDRSHHGVDVRSDHGRIDGGGDRGASADHDRRHHRRDHHRHDDRGHEHRADDDGAARDDDGAAAHDDRASGHDRAAARDDDRAAADDHRAAAADDDRGATADDDGGDDDRGRVGGRWTR